MEDGSSAEIAIVGNEGIVGVALFMGGETTPSRGIVQSAGYAYRLPGTYLKEEFLRAGPLQRLLLRYTQALLTQMAQTAVCNRHHSLEQQLCRWLLLSLDRLPSNELVMTQELIANMLGVRREGVTESAGKLQDLGLIHRYTRRNNIRVLNRPQARGTRVRVLCRGQAGVRSPAALLGGRRCGALRSRARVERAQMIRTTISASSRSQAEPANRLLAGMSRSDAHELQDAGELVELKINDVLHEPASRIRHAYFPTGSIISLMLPLDGGSQLEVGLVGNEGMLGTPLDPRRRGVAAARAGRGRGSGVAHPGGPFRRCACTQRAAAPQVATLPAGCA